MQRLAIVLKDGDTSTVETMLKTPVICPFTHLFVKNVLALGSCLATVLKIALKLA